MPQAECLQVQVDSLCDMAYEREDAGDFREAIRLNKEALALTPEDSLEWQSIITNNISTEYFYLGELESAFSYADMALHVDELRQDSVGISSSVNQMVVVLLQMKQYDRALCLSERTVAIERYLIREGVTDRSPVLAARLGIRSEILTKLGRYAEAVEVVNEAIAIDRRLGDERKLGVHLSQLGNVYAEQKQYAVALPILEEALKRLRASGNIRSLIITLVPYSMALDMTGHRRQAIDAMQECVTLTYQTGQRSSRLNALHELALMTQNSESLPYFRHFSELRDSVYSEQMQQSIADMVVKYDTEKKELELRRQQTIVRHQRWLVVLIAAVALLLLLLIAFIYRYARKQKEIADEKNRMVQILSHDLKAPAVAQQRVLRLVAQGALPMSDELGWQLAEAQDKQVDLILNMLDYVRLEAGKMVPQPIRFSMPTVAADVEALLRQQAEQRHVRVAVLTDADHHVVADRNMVHTILRNLLSNAIRFSPDGGEVRICITPTGFSVEDDGPGFSTPPQSSGGREGSSNSHNTGLGLDISRRFAMLNHATLSVGASASGGGKVTVIFAPRKK